MNKPTREQIETAFKGMKKQIMESKILFTPKWSTIDENVLDYIIEKSIDISLKPAKDISQEETKIIRIFMALVNKAIEYVLNNDEEITNKVYDNFISGGMDEISKDYREFIGGKLKNGLISHEQYEKIKGVEDKLK
jgi:intergrase/recombinase